MLGSVEGACSFRHLNARLERPVPPLYPKADVREGFAALGVALGDVLKFDHAGVRPVGMPWKSPLRSWYPLVGEKPKQQVSWEALRRPLQ